MRSMTARLRNCLAFLLVASMLAVAPAVAAQPQDFDPNLYTSELTGMDVEVSGPVYAITDVELQHYPTGEGEFMQIESDEVPASIEISFFDDSDTPQDTIDIYLASMESAADEFEVVDRGISGDHHYAIALISYDGTEIAYFLQVQEDIDGNTDLFEAVLTGATMLEGNISDAQQEITIGGIGFMENVDAAEVQDVLSSGGTRASSPEATPMEPTDTVTFANSDTTVGIGPDFAFSGEPAVQGLIEDVDIEGPETQTLIAVGQTGDSVDVVLSDFSGGVISGYGEAEVLHEEFGTDSAWQLLYLPAEGGESRYVLLAANTDIVPDAEVLQAHIMPANAVVGSLITIQEQITINGEVLLTDVDFDLIASLVDVNDSGETEADPTADSTGTSDDDRAGDPREDARLPEEDDEEEAPTDGDVENTSETSGSPEPTEEPTEAPTEEVPVDDPGDTAGTLGDGSWEGGVHSHLIEWDPSIWFVDADYPEDLVSDEAAGEDTIVLQSESENGTTWFYITVAGNDSNPPADYLDYWISDFYLDVIGENAESAEVLDYRTRGSNVSVVISYTNNSGDEFILVHQAAVLEDGSISLVTLDMPIADAVDTFDAAGDVTIDGEDVMSVFTTISLPE